LLKTTLVTQARLEEGSMQCHNAGASTEVSEVVKLCLM